VLVDPEVELVAVEGGGRVDVIGGVADGCDKVSPCRMRPRSDAVRMRG
jgi:hypothetical protein